MAVRRGDRSPLRELSRGLSRGRDRGPAAGSIAFSLFCSPYRNYLVCICVVLCIINKKTVESQIVYYNYYYVLCLLACETLRCASFLFGGLDPQIGKDRILVVTSWYQSLTTIGAFV